MIILVSFSSEKVEIIKYQDLIIKNSQIALYLCNVWNITFDMDFYLTLTATRVKSRRGK